MKYSTSLLIIASLSKFVAGHPTPLDLSQAEKRDNEERPGYVKLNAEKTKGSKFSTSKVGSEAYIRGVKQEDGTVEYTLENQQVFYSVDLDVGSNSQSVKLLIDTGSSDMWVVENDNQWCEGNGGSSDDDDGDDDDDWGWKAIKKRLIPSNILSSPGPAKANVEKRDDNPGNVDGEDWEWATGDPFSYFTAEATSTTTSSPQATYDCAKYGTFDPNSSDTWKSNDTEFSITYVDESYAKGTWGQDTVSVNGAKIHNMNLATANDATSEVGVLGISYEYLESSYNGRQSSIYDNLPLKLKLEGLIDKVTYSIYLNDSTSGTANVLFGGIDTDKYVGQLTSLPIINEYGTPKPADIAVTLSSLSIGNIADGTKTKIGNGEAKAILDTGTTLSYIPINILKSIVSELDLHLSLHEGFFMMECSAAKDIYLSYNFQGLEIDVPFESFLLSVSIDEGSKKGQTSQLCAVGILPNNDYLLLGDVFLRNVYMVVDLEDNVVALAPANLDSTSENIEVISGSIPSATSASGVDQIWKSGAQFTTVAPETVAGTPTSFPKTAA